MAIRLLQKSVQNFLVNKSVCQYKYFSRSSVLLVLIELMIRTGSSLGTNKVFFGCGSYDADKVIMMIVGFCGDFLLSP